MSALQVRFRTLKGITVDPHDGAVYFIFDNTNIGKIFNGMCTTKDISLIITRFKLCVVL